MERYGAIVSVFFAGAELPLPISVRLARTSRPDAAGGDDDIYPTSIQLAEPALSVEVRSGDASLADALALGSAGELSIQIAPTRADQAGRRILIDTAVLVVAETQYEQNAPALARLVFAAQAAGGDTDPLTHQEV